MKEGWDPACEDLAEHFIDDPHWQRGRYTLAQVDELRRKLAQRIQDAVEDWFLEQEGDDDGNPTDRG